MKHLKMAAALFLAACASGCGALNGTTTALVPNTPVLKAAIPNTPKQITISRVDTYRVTNVMEKAFYLDQPTRFMFSPDGKTIIAIGTGYEDKVQLGNGATVSLIFVFDAQTGDEIKRFPYTAGRRFNNPGFDNAVLSPDGKFIAIWFNGTPITSALLVVDLEDGQIVAQHEELKWSTGAAAWTASGELLVARNRVWPQKGGHMLICSHDGSTIRKTVDLGDRAVTAIETTQSIPRMLVLDEAKAQIASVYVRPPVESSICSWQNDSLSAPIVRFPVKDVYFNAAFGKDVVALCGRADLRGIHQSVQQALYAVADTKRGRIMWQKRLPPQQFSDQLQFSLDRRKILPQQKFVLDARTGASSPASANDFVVFSPDEKHILRFVTTAVPGATKPHLPIAELLER